MPRLQILEPQSSFGSDLARSLGGGLGKGISEGVDATLSNRVSNMLKIKKEKGAVPGAVNLFAKNYEKGTFDPKTLDYFYTEANKLVDEGYSAQDAGREVINQYVSRKDREAASTPPEQSFLQKQLSGNSIDTKKNRNALMKFLKEQPENLGSAAAKVAYPYVAAGSIVPEITQLLGGLGSEGIQAAAGLSKEERAQRKQRAEQATQAGEKATGLISPFAQGGTSLQEGFLRATGGRGPGENPLERAIQGGLVAGPAGAITSLVGEIGEDLNLPGPARAVVDALTFVGVLKGTQGLKLPSFKANKRILSKAEEVAKASGKTAEEVLKSAQEASGANLGKALEGDAAEINKLNRAVTKEAPAVAGKVVSAEKKFFKPKTEMRRRETTAERLQGSPFAEHYNIEIRSSEKEAAKTPKTLEKEAKIRAEVEPKISEKQGEISRLSNDIRKLRSEAKSASGNDLERIESGIEMRKRQLEKSQEELRDLRYEHKNARKRPSDAEIEADSRKSAEGFLEEARNPTEANQKKMEMSLKKDAEHIEKAEALVNRGEIPGEITPDTFIRTQEKYVEGYNAFIDELREVNRGLAGLKDAQSVKNYQANKKAIDRLQHRVKTLKAKISNQREKIKAFSAIKPASGAFYRQQLKTTRQDVHQFQKDFFEHRKSLSAQELKTKKTAHENIEKVPPFKTAKEATEAGEAVGKNPTSEKIGEAAKATGETAEKIKKDQQTIGEYIKENRTSAESGKATEETVKKSEEKAEKWWDTKKNLTSAGRHFIIGMVTGTAENELNIKIGRGWLYGGAAVFGQPARSVGRGVGFSAGHSLVNYIYDVVEAEKLKGLKNNPSAYSAYIRDMKERYSASRVNKILKRSRQ